MSDDPKPTDPAAEPNDDVKARVAMLQGRESDYKRGEISAHSEDDSVPLGAGGIRHFDGTVVKVNRDGERVLSSYIDPSRGEKLAADVEAEEEAAKAKKAREHGAKATAGHSPDTDAGKAPGAPGSQAAGGDASVVGSDNAGSGDNKGDGSPPIVRELP